VNWLTRVPARRFEPELLDGPIEDRAELDMNLRDMARANWLLGSNRSMIRHLDAWLARQSPAEEMTVLDIATGAGALPRAIAQWARQAGKRVRLIASDRDGLVAGIADALLRPWSASVIRHDARQLPFADASIGVVTCAFALHHLSPNDAIRVLREMARVARIGIIVSDLRRSFLAYGGARVLAYTTRNRLSRHDGPLSVLRAYTPGEAQALLEQAGINGIARAEPLFRLTIVART
jgi:SAM-dependent methyltransferase